MHANTGPNDRIHAQILASDRAWTADEIAREFLKLRAGSAAALVRALLRVDMRFVEENPGRWTARRAASVPLRSRGFAVVWVETGNRSRPETWRVHLRRVPALPDRSERIPSLVLRPSDPAAWNDAFRALEERRLATLHPGPLGRVRQWMGRHWALGGDEETVLDLHALARLALVREGVPPGESAELARLPSLFTRWGLGPIREEPAGVPLPALELLLEHLLERLGDATEEEVVRAAEEALAPRPVPADRFEFALGDLESVPEGSGIYRFLGDGGSLLYVGKAVCLRRRLSSYFRPLPPEPTRREDLLRAIRRFEFTPLPSELEALLRESRAIQEHRPPWNVQVEVHEPEVLPPGWWWPLVFLAPGTDPNLASAFVLTGPEAGSLFHVPRDERAVPDRTLADWLDRVINADIPADENTIAAETLAPAVVEAALESGRGGRASIDADTRGQAVGPDDGDSLERRAGVLPLQAAEVRLAVRYYQRERDRLGRVDAADLTDGQALAEALHRMAAVPVPHR